MKETSIEPNLFRVLCLDGGGAKGFYTLGALKEIEALVGCRLCDRFDLIYGTSTGAIIAALLGLGRSVDEVLALYRKHVVAVMARFLPSKKTAALERLSLPSEFSANSPSSASSVSACLGERRSPSARWIAGP